MVKASAPHKVILFGEHAVVHGRLGIASAIDRRIEIEVSPGSGGVEFRDEQKLNNFRKSRWEVEKSYNNFIRAFAKKDMVAIRAMNYADAMNVVVNEVFNRYGWIDVVIDMKRQDVLKGIGGSAAMFAAMALALSKFRGGDPSLEQVSAMAYLGEVIAHGGMPSGIDNSTVTFGRYLTFRKGEGPRRLDVDFEIPLIIVDSGEPANTSITVPVVKQQMDADPHRVNSILDKLEQISQAGLDAIRNRDMVRIGSLMTEYYETLRQLNISTDKLDLIIRIAIESGALGAKPTGGWGGGVCIILAKDAEHSDSLIKSFSERGFKTFKTRLGAEGVRLEI